MHSDATANCQFQTLKRYSRECSDTLDRITNVPYFDIRCGNGEDQAGVAAVFDRHYIVRMSSQGHDFLSSHQIPHLASSI